MLEKDVFLTFHLTMLLEAREKQFVTYKGTSMRLSVDFSEEKLQAKTERDR